MQQLKVQSQAFLDLITDWHIKQRGGKSVIQSLGMQASLNAEYLCVCMCASVCVYILYVSVNTVHISVFMRVCVCVHAYMYM